MKSGIEELKICDMYLAASLIALGCQMLRYQVDNRRVFFFLENKEGRAQEMVQEYLARRLQVDALTLVDNVKSLKSLCGELTGRPR